MVVVEYTTDEAMHGNVIRLPHLGSMEQVFGVTISRLEMKRLAFL